MCADGSDDSFGYRAVAYFVGISDDCVDGRDSAGGDDQICH